MADSQVEQQVTSQTPATNEQQVTSQTPATKQKNPKRVAAGKAIARKTKEAREAQKRALIEAQSIIAAKVDPPPDTPAADPPPDTPSANLTTTQWLSVISIIVSLAGVYYKRKEIKSVFTQKTPVEIQRFQPPSSLPSPVDATPKRKVGIMKMD